MKSNRVGVGWSPNRSVKATSLTMSVQFAPGPLRGCSKRLHKTFNFKRVFLLLAAILRPRRQTAKSVGLNPIICGFDSHRGHYGGAEKTIFAPGSQKEMLENLQVKNFLIRNLSRCNSYPRHFYQPLLESVMRSFVSVQVA
jgi:hypothetical protein